MFDQKKKSYQKCLIKNRKSYRMFDKKKKTENHIKCLIKKKQLKILF